MNISVIDTINDIAVIAVTVLVIFWGFALVDRERKN